jgi:hypothetical protein
MTLSAALVTPATSRAILCTKGPACQRLPRQ